MRQHNVSRFTQRDMIEGQEWEVTYEAIQKESDAILASEGEFKVRGIDFASKEDAAKARMQVAGERVRTKARQQLEIDAMKARARRNVEELFQASPFCTVCNGPIESLEKATVFTPIGGKDRLIHDNGDCLAQQITASIGRYMGRGRGGVVRRSAS
jgi:hypothetical protein